MHNGKRTVSMAMQVSLPKPQGETKSFLQAFGQANRGTVAKKPVQSPMQPIMLMRSGVVNERIVADDDSRLETLLKENTSNEAVVEELFLASIARTLLSAQPKAINIPSGDQLPSTSYPGLSPSPS